MLDEILSWFEASWQLIADVLGSLLGAMAALLSDLLVWVLAAVNPIVRRVFAAGAEAFGEVIALLPVPDFISGFQAKWNAVPWATLSYFLEPFEVEYGFIIITGAAVLKFGLRVIPFVGVMFRSPST